MPLYVFFYGAENPFVGICYSNGKHTHTQSKGRKEIAVKRIDQLGGNVVCWQDDFPTSTHFQKQANIC